MNCVRLSRYNRSLFFIEPFELALLLALTRTLIVILANVVQFSILQIDGESTIRISEVVSSLDLTLIDGKRASVVLGAIIINILR